MSFGGGSSAAKNARTCKRSKTVKRHASIFTYPEPPHRWGIDFLLYSIKQLKPGTRERILQVLFFYRLGMANITYPNAHFSTTIDGQLLMAKSDNAVQMGRNRDLVIVNTASLCWYWTFSLESFSALKFEAELNQVFGFVWWSTVCHPRLWFAWHRVTHR